MSITAACEIEDVAVAMGSRDNPGKGLLQELIDLDRILTACSIRHALIGGLAIAHHKKFRYTDDVDFAAVTDLSEQGVISTLENYGYVFRGSGHSVEIKGGKFLLFFSPHGTRVDVLYSQSEFIKSALDTADKNHKLGIRVANKEYLAAMKKMSSVSPTRKLRDQKQDESDYLFLIEECGVNEDDVNYLISLAESGV